MDEDDFGIHLVQTVSLVMG